MNYVEVYTHQSALDRPFGPYAGPPTACPALSIQDGPHFGANRHGRPPSTLVTPPQSGMPVAAVGKIVRGKDPKRPRLTATKPESKCGGGLETALDNQDG